MNSNRLFCVGEIWEHAVFMVDVFIIIGRRMPCQTEFHREMAVVLADLDIRQQLTFRRFLLKGRESKGEIGSVT